MAEPVVTPHGEAGAVAAAAAWVRDGGIVAYPTETFYGLAVDPRRREAVEALFEAKGRSARAALPLIGASAAQIEAACGALSGDTATLAHACWPGPLAVLVPTPPGVVPAVDAGTGAVAVRVPAHETARRLADAAGTLITATSANRSGEPPASTVEAVLAWAGRRRLFVLDGGTTAGGAPSTIVDARVRPVVLVREGPVSWERVLELLHA